MSTAVVSPVIVGRQLELSACTAALDRTAAGAAGFVLVGGEAGVGKTRLAEEVGARATAAGFRVLSGRCVELGQEGLPLAPLVDVLRGLVRSTPPDILAGWLGPARASLARLLPRLEVTTEEPAVPAGQPAQLPELVLGMVERISAAQPVLLVVEDLHWADQSTLELVAHLVRTLRDVPVLVLVTYRSDEVHRRHPLRPLLSGWERLRARRLELARFDRVEVAAQVAAILGRPATTQMIDRVLDRSEGNAYLVEELVCMIGADGELLDLSPTLRDLLLVRVEQCSADAQQVLRVAAVAGRRVSERLLGAVVDLGQPALLVALRELVDISLLVIDDSGHGYTFRHALTRDAVYEDMLPGERVRWHAACGQALSESPQLATDDAAAAATLAHHWFTALDLPAALSAALAAAAASTAYAPAEELRHLERALEVWPRVPQAAELAGSDIVDVLHRAAEAALRAGFVDRALSLVDQALRECGEAADPTRRAVLMERRARVLRDLGNEAASLTELQQAQALLPPRPLSQVHAVVLTSLANSLLRAGDFVQAETVADRAVAVAGEIGAAAQEAEARITLGSVRAYLDDPVNGLSQLLAGIRLAEQCGAYPTLLRGYVNHSDVLELLGRHEEAIDAATTGLAVAERVGSGRELGAYLVSNLVEPLIRLGRWSEAEQAVEAAAVAGEPEGVFAATLLDNRAHLAVLAGRHAEAQRLVEQGRRLMGDTRDRQFRHAFAFTLAEAARLTGDLDAAARIVDDALAGEVVTWFGRYSWPLIWLGTRIAVDRALLARDRGAGGSETGRPAWLREIANGLPTRTPQSRGWAASTQAELARLSIADGEPWQAAVACWRTAGEPYPLAYCLLRLAESGAATDRAGAGAAIRESVLLATRLGAAPILVEAEALARRARLPLGPGPERTEAVPALPPDVLARFGLTERERQVLDLLSAGRSNSQIAAALFISPKTASVHVSNILTKLGVSSRVEAAAMKHRLNSLQRPDP